MSQLSKEKCCGCSSCYNACPINCLEMKRDAEGFLYPDINANECIGCKKCEKVCPVINKKKKDTITKPITYAAYSQQAEIRNVSSSGGVFSHIANFILQQEGIVFGVAYDKFNRVRHIYVDNKEKLYKLRGSKYVQSDVGDSYKQAEEFLKQGKWVLYTGTPCQISGLYQYLNEEYDKLITQDIICHGTMSPMIYEKYIGYMESKYNSSIINVSFRDKTYGWNRFSMSLLFENGIRYIKKVNEDCLMRAYLKNVCLRPTCYDCKFKDIARQADITLADFWKIQEIDPEIDSEQGVSLVLLHSLKGKKVFENIKEGLMYKEEDFDEALRGNISMVASVPQHPKRREFMNSIKEGKDFGRMVEKYCHEEWIRRIFCAIKVRIFKKWEKIKKHKEV